MGDSVMSTALRDTSSHTRNATFDPVRTMPAPRAAAALPDAPPASPDRIGRSLGDLTEAARNLLSAGSILGRPFSLHEAAGLLSVPPMHLVPAVGECLTTELLVERGDELAIADPVVDGAVYDALPQPVRLAMHREAARVLEQEGRAPVEVARQLVRGWQLSDRIPGRLLELLREQRGQLSALLAEVVRTLNAADRTSEARDLVNGVLDSDAHPFDLVGVVVALSETMHYPSHAERVAECARRALETDPQPRERARLLVARAVGLSYVGDDTGAEEAAVAALAVRPPAEPPAGPLARPLPRGLRGPSVPSHPVLTSGGRRLSAAGPDDRVRVLADLTRSLAARRRGDLRDAVDHARRAVCATRSQGVWARGLHPELWLAHALAARDEFDEAHVLLDVGQRDSERWTTAWPRPVWHHARASLHLAQGQLDLAEREARTGLWLVDTGGSLYVRLNALLGEVALSAGDLDLAGRYVRRAEQMADLGESSVDDEDLRWRVGLLSAARGDATGAMATLSPLYDRLGRRRELLTRAPRAAARLVWLARDTGDLARARAVVAAAEDLAHRNPESATLRGAAEHARGVLTESRPALRRAARAYESSPRALDRAEALADAGRAERASGSGRAARRLLAEAERCFRQAGALAAAQQAREASTEAASRRRGGDRAPAVTGWESLTEAELRVVRVVAEGLTNKQAADRLFLSPHTVDSHLRHSFAKLGINNRVELACALLREHGESHPENA